MTQPRTGWALIAAAVLILSACGAEVETSSEPSGRSITVTNCAEPLTVNGIPARVVTNDTGITEMMFALGLADRIVGFSAQASKDGDIESSPWKADFEATPDIGDTFTREAVQAVDPDFVFAGWNYGYKESTGLTPDWVRSIGATAYQLTEACRQPGTTQRGIMDPLDALYADIENLGDIFDVRDRADDLVAQYRAEIVAANATASRGQEPTRIFLFDSATPEPFTSGRTAAPSQIFREAGGVNIFDDIDNSWTTASWEAAAQRDPQAIVIVDYDSGAGDTVESKIEQLRQHPLMSGTTAVRKDNITALPYAALVEGPRNPSAVTAIAEFLRSKGL